MKVMVTGGAGYIGAHVLKALLADDHEIAVIDDFSTGRPQRLPQHTRLFEGTIVDPRFVESALREHSTDAVVHLAAKKAVAESIANPLRYYEENVMGTHSLLKAMKAVGTPTVLFSSSAAVYGQTARGAVTEAASTNPSSPYGWTKLMCEQMIRDVAMASNMDWAALRYFNVAGAANSSLSDLGESNLIPRTFRAISLGCSPQVFGNTFPTRDGTCVRDYVHVQDVADAHAVALDNIGKASSSSIYNLGTGKGASVLDVLDAVKSATGVKFSHDICEIRSGDPAEVIADTSKIRSELGWRPKYDLMDIIESAWMAWQTKSAS